MHWVWLPVMLAGPVFTRRVTEDEVSFELLTVTPDLDAVAVDTAAFCAYAPYQRLAEGCPVHLVPAGDERLLDQLDIPLWLLDSGDALALAVETFEALGVNGGDLIGLRLSTAGLVVERVGKAATTTGVCGSARCSASN